MRRAPLRQARAELRSGARLAGATARRAGGEVSRGVARRGLRPATFRYKHDPSRERQYGLVAEEVARVYPELVTRTPSGEVLSVRYEELTPMLLNELQRQRADLDAEARQITRLEAQKAELSARLERLEESTAAGATLARR